ncbi:hypothetical protein AALB53_08155 [Lachnospiraceae bacterium 47-T17]
MGRKIDNSDKHNLQTIGFVAIFIAICVAIFVGTRYVPLVWIAVIAVVCEVFFLMPKVCEMYYEMFELDAGIGKYVPGLNIIKTFSPVLAKIIMTVTALAVIAGACVTAPAHLVEPVFGEVFALNFNGRSFIIFFLLLVLCSILIGIGYCDVLHNISNRLYDLYNLRLGGTTWLWRIFLFIPILRACGLSFIYQQLYSLKLQSYGNTQEYEDEFYEEEEFNIG